MTRVRSETGGMMRKDSSPAIGRRPLDAEDRRIKIHTLENEGDSLFRSAVGELFAQTTDPIEIIKWKDLHGLIEVAIDRCEDVANIVETIVVKHR